MVLENTGQGCVLPALIRSRAGFVPPSRFAVLCGAAPMQTKDLLTITADTGWKQVDTTFSGATRMHAFTFAAPTDDRLEGIEVKVTVDVDDPNSALIWDLRVANDNPRWALWRIVFPQAAVRDLGEDAKVFAQVTSGVELSEMWSKGGRRGGPYPGGWTCMQYMAAYNRADGTGLYVGMHDPFGSTDIFAEGQPAKEPSSSPSTTPCPTWASRALILICPARPAGNCCAETGSTPHRSIARGRAARRDGGLRSGPMVARILPSGCESCPPGS